jgi:Zn-dependent M28 family amino/carboxypeptidase
MLALLLAASLAFSAEDAALAYSTAARLVSEHTPRDAGTRAGRLAADYILKAAKDAGAEAVRDEFAAMTPKGECKFVNVYAEFKGDPSAPWTVVVSHYDTKPGVKCPGANDGASTSGLLVALAVRLSACKERRGNVMLLWTDGEECMQAYREDDGFWGSKRAATKLKEKGVKVAGVVCVDMVGDRNLAISIPRNSSPALAKIALEAAKRAGVQDKVSKSDILVKDDHVPFMEAGFPAIDLIDFDYGSKPGLNDWWHTEKDTMDKVSRDSLECAGKLVAEMLNILAPVQPK